MESCLKQARLKDVHAKLEQALQNHACDLLENIHGIKFHGKPRLVLNFDGVTFDRPHKNSTCLIEDAHYISYKFLYNVKEIS